MRTVQLSLPVQCMPQQVDMGSSYAVGYVAIYNRINCCRYRLNSYEIWLGDSAGSRSTKCAAGVASATAALVVHACLGSGRYVTLLLP